MGLIIIGKVLVIFQISQANRKWTEGEWYKGGRAPAHALRPFNNVGIVLRSNERKDTRRFTCGTAPNGRKMLLLIIVIIIVFVDCSVCVFGCRQFRLSHVGCWYAMRSEYMLI